METITVKYNKKSKAGKAVEAVLKALNGLPGVEIITSNEKHYDPEFVKKIRRAEKQVGVVVNTSDIWGSLGLK